MDISVIIPLFNEEESLPELNTWICNIMNKNNFTYEIIYVDDGSNDDSWKVIYSLSKQNKDVKGLRFKRNYGKSAALFCGFEKCKGNVVITMDADLQDSPEEIPALYNKIINDEFDLVSGWKQKRYDPVMKTVPSKLFNYTARRFSNIKLHDFNCGLKAYKKEVVKSIEVYGEMHRYIPILAKQAGFSNIGEQIVHHQARKYGTSKFGLNRFINGFLDLLSILFITRFGKKPMHFFGTIGSLIFLIGFISILVIGFNKLYALGTGEHAPLITASPYFYIALTSMVLGTQLFLAGFLAELISRNSSERNKYLIKEVLE